MVIDTRAHCEECNGVRPMVKLPFEVDRSGEQYECIDCGLVQRVLDEERDDA